MLRASTAAAAFFAFTMSAQAQDASYSDEGYTARISVGNYDGGGRHYKEDGYPDLESCLAQAYYLAATHPSINAVASCEKDGQTESTVLCEGGRTISCEAIDARPLMEDLVR